jgi:two-component system phosphate regulon response regulator PhoB
MSQERILVVEDETDIRELITYNLLKHGYDVFCAVTGEEAVSAAQQEEPALILLDLMLPKMDGFEVCRQLKRNPATKEISIIMLTAKGEDADVVAGLELGADDYVTKPFRPQVLLARIRNVLRRKRRSTKASETGVIRIRDLQIDERRFEVILAGIEVVLTRSEFRLLQLLASHPGQVFTRDQIVDKVHGEDYPVTSRSVDVQVVSLRKKLFSSNYIETVRGVGYRFKE